MSQVTIGQYLAQRLVELGLTDYFAIPGDFNLALLDELLKQPRLRMLNCCNELNAAYAADGYARGRGAAAMVVTYGVGGLSAVNGLAGAYAEDLPVIAISGGPNLNAMVDHRVLHHTLARPEDGERDIQAVFRQVTTHAVVIRDAAMAALQMDEAIRLALAAHKPVYLEIACNLAGTLISAPNPLRLRPTGGSCPESLARAVSHVAAFLNAARQPVLVAGSRLRPAGGLEAFANLAAACGYGVACMPNAKGFYPETEKQFMGIYWAGASSPGCREVVEASDAYLFAGPVFNDYTTVGFSALLKPGQLVEASPARIVVEGQSYHGIQLAEFLEALAPRLVRNGGSLEAYDRIREPAHPPIPPAAPAPLSTRRLYHHLNAFLDGRTTVIAETGDSWFNGMELRLPEGSRFEIQMQYGSIGWSVGAFLGLAAEAPGRRVLGLIGDGAFQMSAQEVATLLRYGLSGVLVLMNNAGYAIEAMIHDGPYNTIQNWHYAQLAESLEDRSSPTPRLLARVARTEEELLAALEESRGFQGLTFIEAILDRLDCNKVLMGWGTAVAAYNAAPEKQ